MNKKKPNDVTGEYSVPNPTKNLETRLNDTAAKLSDARAEVGKTIFGQNQVVDQIFISLMAGGHVLLIGVPGLAKTLMVETIATVMGLSTGRIQCTPDLMPADILGSEVLEENEQGQRNFRFIKGPVFTQFLMADEINRASPRTQSALLQAMQEKQVSISGKQHDLPSPFHVLATQNPIEQEGTYPLPEAQLDRFLMQINVNYPDIEAEKEIILATTGNETHKTKAILQKSDLLDIQKTVRDIPVGEKVIESILSIVRGARPHENATSLMNEYIEWAPGPRASQALMQACRAKALLENRAAPSIDDVIALTEPVLRHRMALNYKAHADGITIADIVKDLIKDL